MLTFKRLSIKPSYDFIYNLSVKTMAWWIPTSYRWFSPTASNGDQELGKLIRAWARTGAELRAAIETQRWEVFVQTADADYLNKFGALIDVTRKAGESDDDYAARIVAELNAGRVTKKALEQLVLNLSENQVSGNIFLPSDKVILWGDLWWNKYWPSPDYWRGATFELQTNDTAPEDLEAVVKKSKAAGVKDWYARIIDVNLDQNDDPNAAIVNGVRQSFVTDSVDITIESVGCGTDVIPVVHTLPTELSIVGPDMGNVLTWGMGLTFENIPTNYALATDMLLSAQTGVAQHYVKVTTPFDVNAVTDLQAAPYVQFTGVRLNDGTVFNSGGFLGL